MVALHNPTLISFFGSKQLHFTLQLLLLVSNGINNFMPVKSFSHKRMYATKEWEANAFTHQSAAGYGCEWGSVLVGRARHPRETGCPLFQKHLERSASTQGNGANSAEVSSKGLLLPTEQRLRLWFHCYELICTAVDIFTTCGLLADKICWKSRQIFTLNRQGA